MRYPIQKDGTREAVPLWFVMSTGSIAGNLMWLAAFPFDLVKTLMQTDKFKTPVYKGTLQTMRTIYKAGGIAGFYKGLLPCMVRGVPVNAAVFGTFETMKSQLNHI